MNTEEFKKMIAEKTKESMQVTDALLNWFKSQEVEPNLAVVALTELLAGVLSAQVKANTFSGLMKMELTIEMLRKMVIAGAKPNAS